MEKYRYLKMQSVVLTLVKNNTEKIWSLPVQDSALAAGMLAVSIPMYAASVYKLVSDVAILPRYQIAANIVANSTNVIASNKIKGFKYGMWIRSETDNFYNMFAFSNFEHCKDFCKGILLLCKHSQVDFRNYVYKHIFDENNEKFELVTFTSESSYSKEYIVNEKVEIDDTDALNKQPFFVDD